MVYPSEPPDVVSYNPKSLLQPDIVGADVRRQPVWLTPPRAS